MAGDKCAACGHARVFHQIGTGNGVPVGKQFCDDRHADPCSCAGFMDVSPIAKLKDEVRELGRRLSAVAARVQLSSVAECFIAGNHEIRDGDYVRFDDGHAAHVSISRHEPHKWTYTDRNGHHVEPFRVPPEDGIERLYTIAEVAEIVARVTR